MRRSKSQNCHDTSCINSMTSLLSSKVSLVSQYSLENPQKIRQAEKRNSFKGITLHPIIRPAASCRLIHFSTNKCLRLELVSPWDDTCTGENIQITANIFKACLQPCLVAFLFAIGSKLSSTGEYMVQQYMFGRLTVSTRSHILLLLVAIRSCLTTVLYCFVTKQVGLFWWHGSPPFHHMLACLSPTDWRAGTHAASLEEWLTGIVWPAGKQVRCIFGMFEGKIFGRFERGVLEIGEGYLETYVSKKLPELVEC